MPIDLIRGSSHSLPPPEGGNRKKDDEKRLERVCQEFESLLIHQMMKTMRHTIPETGFLAEGKERKIFQALFDEEISKIASKRGGLGLGKMLYLQMLKRGGSPLVKEGDSESR